MALPAAQVHDPLCQLNWEVVAGHVLFGVGVPTLSPGRPAIYIRSDGGAGSTLYVFEAGAWVAK